MSIDSHTSELLLSVFRTPETRDLVVAAIDAQGSGPAAAVAALGTTTNIPTVSVTLSTSNTYTDSAVKTAIDSGANAVRTATEARLDAIEAKIDDLIAKLKAAALMSA